MEVRIAEHTTSAFGVATGVAGAGVGGAALAGVMDPVIGWAVASVGALVLISKFAITYTIGAES